MRPRWKLSVEGLGVIARAEIDVRPLLLLIGENGTGKTMLASLLWGLLAMQPEVSPPPGEALTACERWLSERTAEGEAAPPYTLTDEDRALFMELFNETLAHDAARLVDRVIPGLRAPRLRVSSAPTLAGTAVTLDPARAAESAAPGETLYVSADLLSQMGPAYRRYLLKTIAAHVATGWRVPQGGRRASAIREGAPIFLPSARSGLMLLYRAAVRDALRRGEDATGEHGEHGSLEAPETLTQFVRLLSVGLSYERGPYNDEAALLEECLDGTVELVPGIGANDYRYHPRGGAPLPLSLAPSFVTALAPMILALRHLPSVSVLVIEEPTALVHPRLYRRMAQAFVRLVRKGVYVWITTTSERFCREVNHFAQVGAREGRERRSTGLEREELDYLEAEEIAGYHLRRSESGAGVTVDELTRFDDGLAIASLHEELVAPG
jgi:energy-coupling factor transporter ATP-binding protein EcfA2